jgi:CDP-diacylglycerol--glycerol-3-phosphate 3-phosphatidyltransferase
MGLPNAITILRIVLVGVFLALAYAGGTVPTTIALVVFLIASGSDFVDGYIARRQGTVSRMGQWLDPLADKLLIGAALIVLVDLRPFPLWAALVIAVREALVTILRARIVAGGGSLPASLIGKTKTVVQMVMVTWWLIPWNSVNAIHWVLLYAALFVTVYSGLEYVRESARTREAVV